MEGLENSRIAGTDTKARIPELAAALMTTMR
jgi:hypothetical protein